MEFGRAGRARFIRGGPNDRECRGVITKRLFCNVTQRQEAAGWRVGKRNAARLSAAFLNQNDPKRFVPHQMTVRE
jgi:hypothetical protein